MDWGVNVFRKPGTPPKNNIPKNHGISKLVVWRSKTPAIHIQTPLQQGPMILRDEKRQNNHLNMYFLLVFHDHLSFWWGTFFGGGLILRRSKGNLLWEYLSMTWPSSTNMPLKASTSICPSPKKINHHVTTCGLLLVSPTATINRWKKTIQRSLTMTCSSNRK